MTKKKEKDRIREKGHHWIGEKPTPDLHYGFIYLITNCITGMKYIGRKNYHFKKQGVKGCKSTPTTDRQSPKWKPGCYKDSDWRTYMGSSKHLAKDIKEYGKESFTFCILKQCRSKGTLSYSECEELIRSKSMSLLDEHGEYVYHNMTVPRIRFKVPKVYNEEKVVSLNQYK